MPSSKMPALPDPEAPTAPVWPDGPAFPAASTAKAPALPDPETTPTVPVSVAGKALGLSKNSTYEAIKRGEIPVLRIGRRLVCPTAALRRMVQLDDSPDAA